MTSLITSARAAGRRLIPATARPPEQLTRVEPHAPARSRPAPDSLPRIALLALVPAIVSAGVLSLRSEHLEQPGLRAAYIAVTLALAVLVGISWWWRRPQSRIGPFLVLYGYLGWLLAWQASDEPLAFVVGIAAEPILAFLTVYLVLAFPSGRLLRPADRIIAISWAFIAATAWLGAIVFVSDLGPASPLSACLSGCPENPLVVATLPSSALQFGGMALALAGLMVMVSVLASMAQRTLTASRAAQRELLPVFAVTALYVIAFVLHHGARFAAPTAAVADATEAVLVAARLVFPLGFLAALVLVERFAVASSRRLAAKLMTPRSAAQIESQLSDAVQDPGLRLGIWDVRGHAYHQPDDSQLERSSVGPQTMWLSVRDHGERLAAIVTDAGFVATPQLLEALETSALIQARALVQSQQADALRARAVEAGDAERRRIARDLHDSAQQRLVALRVQMMLAGERSDTPDSHRVVAEHLAIELDLAIDELRVLARRFLVPAALGNGVAPALRAVADSWPVRVTVTTRGLARHPADVELAVYNCCLEALQNVADHAGPEATVNVHIVERRQGIHFVVQDDGVGFDPAATERGAGLARLVDRAVVAGGCASIKTAPGRGVRVAGLIPVPGLSGAA